MMRFRAGRAITLCIFAAVFAGPVLAGDMGSDDFYISGPGCRFPDIAYNSTNGNYLVVWVDYSAPKPEVRGRLISADGTLSQTFTKIVDVASTALYPAVAYNAAANEFLVTWDDDGRAGSIYGQRLRGSDGARLGTNFPIITAPGGIRSAVAWSSISNCYLVVCFANLDIYGQRVSASGELIGPPLNISNDSALSLYPSVCYSSTGDQFLVTWDHSLNTGDPEIDGKGYIRGKRVAASTGVISGAVNVTTTGNDCRSSAAFDPSRNRWLVQFTKFNTGGYGSDVYGQFVTTNGSLAGGQIAIAHTPAFEGETLLGTDVAFTPGAGRYLSVFQSFVGDDGGMGYQELLGAGGLVGDQSMLGWGSYGCMAVAADPIRDRFLCVWESLEGPVHYIRGQLYAVREPITNLSAVPSSGANTLSWTNPSDSRFVGTMIRFSTSNYPMSPADGTLVVNKTNVPGSTDSYTHTALTNGVPCYYSVFTYDALGNYSAPVTRVSCPWPEQRSALSSTTFNSGSDGWSVLTWKFLPEYSPGTMEWVADAGRPGGGMRCCGAGSSDNTDRCTREGGEIRKTFSLTGYKNILLSYDLRVGRLGANLTGAGVGSCAVDHGLIDEQLSVFFSTDGGDNWTEIDWLRRSELLSTYTSYRTRQIDLSQYPQINNCPQFILRFRWQLNCTFETCDYGDLDNITLSGDSVTVSDIKTLPDGSPVLLSNKAFYLRHSEFGYIQEPDRTCGIRIQGDIEPAAGTMVTVSGTVQTTVGGERYIQLGSMQSTGAAEAKPLGANNTAISRELMDGLYVRLWGVVKRGSITSNSFVISDGSGTDGIKIITEGAPEVTEGEFVTITGAAGVDGGSRIVYAE